MLIRGVPAIPVLMVGRLHDDLVPAAFARSKAEGARESVDRGGAVLVEHVGTCATHKAAI
jgi:hypothetical protein